MTPEIKKLIEDGRTMFTMRTAGNAGVKPVKDSRLADALEVAVKALKFYANIEADGTADFALAEIQKIAERKL